MKVGVFTDSHYSDKEISCKTRRPILSYQKIKDAMEVFRREKVELVICLGDLLDSCNKRADEPNALRMLGEMILSFQIPFYCLRGNHDCDNFNEIDFLRYSGFSVVPFSLQCGDRLLLFLDANVKESGEKYLPRQVDWTDSTLPQEQVEQLKLALKGTDAKDIYIFLHQRLDPCDNTHYLIKNACEIRELLQENGKVRKVFQGHYHKGDYQKIGQIEYITLRAMCEGEQNEYSIIEL